MNSTLETVSSWMKKADNDFIAARQILLLEDAPTDTVCFHAQQVVEKAMKALLTHRGLEIPKTHKLLILLELLSDVDFESYREACILLAEHAVEARYPGDYIEPEREEAEESLRIALEIFSLIKSKLEAEA